MDVINAEQARIAEDAGAVAVMALERVPADIRKDGGVARMSDPDMIDQIINAVSIPVMAKARIGHFVEAQILESLKVDYIDESEVLSPADYINHIDNRCSNNHNDSCHHYSRNHHDNCPWANNHHSGGLFP